MDSTQLDALLAQVVPAADRGRAVLVAGGTREERRRVIDALSVRPSATLVVRVGARAAEARLADEVVAAAEAALRSVRAPGGLYEDACGGPFAGLGGWLFRARSVGRAGIVLVVEEIDRWLEARGASQADPTAGPTLLDALGQCGRRALSVVCTAPSIDAAGEPAISSSLAQRFDLVERLPGANVVERDPGGLGTQLAGRSYSLRALREGLPALLGLAPDAPEDTVLHFRAQPVEAAVDWPEPVRPASSPPAVRSRSEPAPASSPSHAARLDESVVDAVRCALEVREVLRALDPMDGPRSARQIERILRAGLWRLPAALETLARAEKALLLEPVKVARAGRSAWASFERVVSDALDASMDAWVSGAQRPSLLFDLPPILQRVAAERRARGTLLVLLHGLRFDAWQRLRARVLTQVPGLDFVDDGVHWAVPPVSSSRQRDLLVRGMPALRGATLSRDEPAPPRSLEESARPRRELLGSVEVHRIDAYAVARRGAPSLHAWWDASETALASPLRELLTGAAPGTLVMFAADLGLPDPGDGTPATRPSAVQVLAPWALARIPGGTAAR